MLRNSLDGCDQASATTDPQLAVHVLQVLLHGARADPQIAGGLTVIATAGNVLDHLPFAGGQRRHAEQGLLGSLVATNQALDCGIEGGEASAASHPLGYMAADEFGHGPVAPREANTVAVEQERRR